jgi:hypothetical protein
MMRMRKVILGIGLALSLGAPASAGAADFYVDRDVGVSDPDCELTAPCSTIATAINLSDNNADHDNIHVGRSSVGYAAAVTIPNFSMTLIGGDYDGAGAPAPTTILDAGATTTVTFASGATARAIRGFVIQGGTGAMPNDHSLDATVAPTNVTIENNTFNENSASLIKAMELSGSPAVRNNVIALTEAVATSAIGINLISAASPEITGNNISGAERSISISGGTSTAVVSGNVVSPAGDDLAPGAGIFINASGGTVTGNLITPGPGLGVSSNGMYITGDGPGTRALSRNRIFGFPDSGVYIGTPDPVTFNGDVIASNAGSGIENLFIASDLISVNNATVWGNDTAGTVGEIGLGGSLAYEVAIDSSIIGDDGVKGGGGAASCTATFSRGPATSTACAGAFTTAATPSFVNAGANNFHLTEAGNSALIDTGNPGAAPGVDLDGNSLLLSGAPCATGAGRRDIGADEVAPAPCPASTPPPVQTGQRAAALKKCKKKKSKKARKKCKKRAKLLPL